MDAFLLSTEETSKKENPSFQLIPEWALEVCSSDLKLNIVRTEKPNEIVFH